MKNKTKKPGEIHIVKKCDFCDATFYAKRVTALYCSDSHKALFNRQKRENQGWYSQDPNKGKRFPLGTITSWEMPEDKLVLQADKESIYRNLSAKISEDQLIEEKVYIEKLKPFSESKDWAESSVQIFSDNDFMEVFRISSDEYKFYVWPWDQDNEKPFL